MFNLTKSAYDKLLPMVEEEKKTPDEKLFLRLTMGIGCGGPQLKLSLEERPLLDDELYEIEELNILIHKRDQVYFDHTKLDYVTDVFGRGRFQVLKV